MTKLINKLTGGDMWVAENRVDEYKAAGHILAAKPISHEEPEEEKPKKAIRKRK